MAKVCGIDMDMPQAGRTGPTPRATPTTAPPEIWQARQAGTILMIPIPYRQFR
jgi:hypothetical protein